MMEMLREPSKKGACVTSKKSVTFFQSLSKNSPRRMPIKILTYFYGVGVMRNNFIFNVTQEAMTRMIPNGIPQYMLKYIEEVEFKPIPPDVVEPETFDVKDLEFGFVIFLVCCGVSTLAFLGELSYFYGRELIGLIILMRFLAKENFVPEALSLGKFY